MVTGAIQVPLGGGVGERVRDEHAGVGGGTRGVEVASEPRHLVGKGHDRTGLGTIFHQLNRSFTFLFSAMPFVRGTRNYRVRGHLAD